MKGRQREGIFFLCPGGVISKAVLEATGKPSSSWQDVYLNADKLYQLAKAMRDYGGMDNYAVPLCLTVEAELFGAQVDYQPSICELKIRDYPFPSLEELLKYEKKNTRCQELVLEVIKRLRSTDADASIIGNVTGPFTLLTQLVDPSIIFKAILRHQDLLHQAIQKLAPAIDEYGQQQIKAGVDALIIGEPTANGEILGVKFFAQFCTPYLRRLLKSFGQHLPGKIILHICGRIDNLLSELRSLPFSGLSIDSKVDIKGLRQMLKDKIIIGSICTHALANQTPAQVMALSRQVINQGVDALCLPCGLNPATPLENLQAMREVLKSKPENQ